MEKPVTIMTYIMLDKLARAGIISGKNVDVIVSDEAHEGLSPRKQESLSDAFTQAGNTMLAAYTATPYRYSDQSVHDTHQQIIYKRSLYDALMEYDENNPETVPYIDTEFYLTRLPSSKERKENEIYQFNHEFMSDSLCLRRKDWMHQMIQIYDTGHNPNTGDPLSDSVAAFYSTDTAQATAMANLLNAHPALSAKAEKMGYKKVAVDLHSNIPKAQLRENMRLLESGQAMAFTGDKKMRLGFDHPPLKVIFDNGRSSYTDLAQIIGRGARFWRNPAKGNRSEGLIFIQHAYYYGSDDQEAEEYFKGLAKDSLLSAHDVLAKDPLLSLKEKPKQAYDPNRDNSYSRPDPERFHEKVIEFNKELPPVLQNRLPTEVVESRTLARA